MPSDILLRAYRVCFLISGAATMKKSRFAYCLNIRSFFHGGFKMRHQYYSARIELMI